MVKHRSIAVILVGALASIGGCQLISGLSGLHEGSGASGGASSSSSGTGGATGSSSTSSSSSGMGGATSSSSSGTGGATSSSSGTGGATSSSTSSSSTTSSSTSSSSSSGCTGSCPPTLVATDAGNGPPTALAADGAFVYWASNTTPNRSILRAAIGGGTPEKIADGAAVDMVADANNLYWMDLGVAVWRSPKVPGLAGQLAQIPVNEGPTELRQIGSNLYWATNGGFTFSSTAGGGTSSLSVTGVTATTRFAVDNTKIYWVESAAGTLFHGEPFMSSGVPTSGSSVPAAAMVADADVNGYVYFIGANEPVQVYHARKSDGLTEKIASTQLDSLVAGVARIVVTPTYVYWTDITVTSGNCATPFNINRSTIPGNGIVEIVATVAGCPLLAKDAGAVYYNDGQNIYRVASP